MARLCQHKVHDDFVSSCCCSSRMQRDHVEIIAASSSGDSYSSVGYLIRTHPHPTPSNPLGIPFPGETYATQRQLWRRVASEEQPNWVGHLITKYSPGTNYRKGTKPEGANLLANLVPSKDHAPSDSSLVVFDFAKGGATITDVKSQISKQFVLVKPERATWAAEDSLFGNALWHQKFSFLIGHSSDLGGDQ
jgi:hypothetical protein